MRGETRSRQVNERILSTGDETDENEWERARNPTTLRTRRERKRTSTRYKKTKAY